MSSALQLTCAILLGLAGSPLLAQSPPEPALATAATDAQLKWGPCPSFIPAGCEIAVLHGDPGKANADLFFRLPPDFTVPRHWHTSAERMVLISGELQVTYDGQQAVTLKPGMYAYGPARRPHSARCGAGTSCVLFIAFEQPVDAEPMAAEPAGAATR